MKKFLSIAFLAITVCVSAQNGGTISGKITDSELNDEPLLMANVAIKNSDIATRTNLNGNFEITGIDSGTYVLTLGFAGYDTIEIPVTVWADNTTYIEQGLLPKSLSLDQAMLDEITPPHGNGPTQEAEK